MTHTRNVRDQLKTLESLQELDLKIDQLKKKKAEIPAALKGLDDAVAGAERAVQAKANAIAEIEKAQRQTVAAMDLNQDRLTRSNAKLEAVANSQEFQAASKELEQLRKQALAFEEQKKKSATDKETAEKELATLNEKLAQVRSERDAKAGQLSGETGKLDTEISTLLGQRSTLTPNVDPRILAQYDRIRAGRGGVGVSPAANGRCGSCNMVLPPQLFIEVQRANTIHQCPSCFRMLLAPSAPGSRSPDVAV